MKLLMKNIDVIAWFDKKGDINPCRFRIANDDKEQIRVNIDRIIGKTQERFAGNIMIVFDCQSVIKNTERRYQIKYEVATQKWFLYKI